MQLGWLKLASSFLYPAGLNFVLHSWIPLAANTKKQHCAQQQIEKMETLPSTLIAIKGIKNGAFEWSCPRHPYWGCIVELNMVVRLKLVRFRTSKCPFCSLDWFPEYLHLVCSAAIGAPPTIIIGAFAISNGMDDCQIGYLPEDYPTDETRLQGCLVQIAEIFHDSMLSKKRALSAIHNRLYHGIIIDQVNMDNEGIVSIIDGYAIDSKVASNH